MDYKKLESLALEIALKIHDEFPEKTFEECGKESKEFIIHCLSKIAHNMTNK